MDNKQAVLFCKKEPKNFYVFYAGVFDRPQAQMNQSFFASFCSQKEVLKGIIL
jgi:hypothetical protein